MNEEIKPVRIHIHPELETELQLWKKILEDKAGHELNGGRPTVSKLCAQILKELRTKSAREKKHLIIEIKKIPRVGKCEVIFL